MTTKTFSKIVTYFIMSVSILCASFLSDSINSYASGEDLSDLNLSIKDQAIANRSSYNAVDDGLITSVKDQGNTGLCWLFSDVAKAEISLVKNGYANNSIDLSEVYSLYRNRNSAPTTDGGLYNTIFNSGTPSYNYYINESSIPWSSLLNAKNSTSNTIINLCKQYTNKESYAVINTWSVLDDVNALKKLIAKNGAVELDYYASDRYSVDAYGRKVYYTNYPYSDHAIIAVGWDDNFPKSSFNNNNIKNNGAILCRNSWGTNWGNQGYFWMSYESDFGFSASYAVPTSLFPKAYPDETVVFDANSTSRVIDYSAIKEKAQKTLPPYFKVGGGDKTTFTYDRVGEFTNEVYCGSPTAVHYPVKTYHVKVYPWELSFRRTQDNEPKTYTVNYSNIESFKTSMSSNFQLQYANMSLNDNPYIDDDEVTITSSNPNVLDFQNKHQCMQVGEGTTTLTYSVNNARTNYKTVSISQQVTIKFPPREYKELTKDDITCSATRLEIPKMNQAPLTINFHNGLHTVASLDFVMSGSEYYFPSNIAALDFDSVTIMIDPANYQEKDYENQYLRYYCNLVLSIPNHASNATPTPTPIHTATPGGSPNVPSTPHPTMAPSYPTMAPVVNPSIPNSIYVNTPSYSSQQTATDSSNQEDDDNVVEYYESKSSYWKNNIQYQLTEKGTAIVLDAKNKKTLTIPAVVKYNGSTYKVTTINHDAFCFLSKVKTIVIKGKVTIKKAAIKSCPKLKKITFTTTSARQSKLHKQMIYGMKKGKFITIKCGKKYKSWAKTYKNKKCMKFVK